MKKIILCLLILQTLIPNVFSQCDDYTIQTPMGSDIKACYGNWSDDDIEDAEEVSRSYTIYEYDAGTNSYNCHGYAWNVSEGGSEYWVNNVYIESGNLDAYWEDGSYIELTGQRVYDKFPV